MRSACLLPRHHPRGGVFSPKLSNGHEIVFGWLSRSSLSPLIRSNTEMSISTTIHTARDTMTRRIEISYMRNIILIHSTPPPYTIEGLLLPPPPPFSCPPIMMQPGCSERCCVVRLFPLEISAWTQTTQAVLFPPQPGTGRGGVAKASLRFNPSSSFILRGVIQLGGGG